MIGVIGKTAAQGKQWTVATGVAKGNDLADRMYYSKILGFWRPRSADIALKFNANFPALREHFPRKTGRNAGNFFLLREQEQRQGNLPL